MLLVWGVGVQKQDVQMAAAASAKDRTKSVHPLVLVRVVKTDE